MFPPNDHISLLPVMNLTFEIQNHLFMQEIVYIDVDIGVLALGHWHGPYQTEYCQNYFSVMPINVYHGHFDIYTFAY